jgi:hypothetical protein
MADRALSTSRRALLGAAASLPVLAIAPSTAAGVGDRAEWDRRLARYRSLAARAKAAAETGWFRAANDRYYRECVDPAADRKVAFARVDRAEDLYWRRCTNPMQKAAVALVVTPVPDLEALRAKIAVIRAHQLHELDSMTRDCFKVLEEDVLLVS